MPLCLRASTCRRKKMEFQAAEDTSEVFYGGVAVTLAFPLCLPGSRTVTFYLR